jgi:predicted amidohydrolase
LGLSLEDIISKVTEEPAKRLGESHRRGRLTVGYPADITLFEWLEGEFVFVDGIAGNTLVGNQLLEPRMTIKNGTILPAQSRFRDPLPGENVTLTKGA